MSPEYIRKEKNKNNEKTKTKKKDPPPKNPDVLKAMFEEIDLQPYRQKYGPKGVYVENVFDNLITDTLGDPDRINHRNYKSIKLALHTWCQMNADRNPGRPNPYLVDKPSPGPSPEDQQAEQEKADYNRIRDLIAKLDDHEKRALTDYAKDLLKKESPTLKPKDLGYDIQLKISETDAYKRIYE